MTHKNLEDALDLINPEIAANAMTAQRSRRSHIKPAVIAAAAAVVLCGATAAAQAGGLIDIKNAFGAITGQEYVADATSEISVRFLGYENGEPKLDISIANPTEPPYIELSKGMATIRPISYEVTGAGELLKEWVEEKGTDGSGGICLNDMHPLIAVGRPIETWEADEEYFRTMTKLYGWNFDNFEFQYESAGCGGSTCRSSDGSISSITISQRNHYIDITTGEEIIVTVKSETYEAKDLAPWKVPINATGSEYDPTIPPEDGAQIVMEDENVETVTPEDGYNTLDELKPLTISIDSFLIESKGDQPLEIRGHWTAEMEL